MPDAGWSIAVESKSGLTTFPCQPDESLLYAGLRAGFGLPYECATGTCGSCRARVMQGEVAVGWDEAPGHAKLKRERGEILMCQSRPASEIKLRVPAIVPGDLGRYPVPAACRGVLERIERLTSDVAEFAIALDRPMRFEAGQFVALGVPGLEGLRAYSMVNHAAETDRLVLVIKRKLGGGFGDWLFDGTRAGTAVSVFGPLGRATFHPEEGHHLLMVAGGSGIAGMMAILDRATREGYFRTRRGAVFFGVRTLADGFYLDAFSRAAEAAGDNLSITLAISHETPPGTTHPDHPRVALREGMVHQVCADAMAGACDGTMAYVAGPPPMVDGALRALIVSGRMTPDRIRYDKFG